MTEPNLSTEALFKVDGLVAVITGGGSGTSDHTNVTYNKSLLNNSQESG